MGHETTGALPPSDCARLRSPRGDCAQAIASEKNIFGHLLRPNSEFFQKYSDTIATKITTISDATKVTGETMIQRIILGLL